MTCHGCREPLIEGGWFFTDAPPGRKIALCDPCHRDSVPSRHRREWVTFPKPRFTGLSALSTGMVNTKIAGQANGRDT